MFVVPVVFQFLSPGVAFVRVYILVYFFVESFAGQVLRVVISKVVSGFNFVSDFFWK